MFKGKKLLVAAFVVGSMALFSSGHAYGFGIDKGAPTGFATQTIPTPTLGSDAAYTLVNSGGNTGIPLTQYTYDTSTHATTAAITKYVNIKQTSYNDGSAQTITYSWTDPSLTVTLSGGSIQGSLSGTTLSGDFIGNAGSEYTVQAGTTAISGNFIGNIRTSGFAAGLKNAYELTSITGHFIGNINTDVFTYGAIYNYKSGELIGKIGTITGDFIGNKPTANGGAIYNSNPAEIGTINGDFIGNSTDSNGGAIYNRGIIDNINSNFIINKAAKTGGAIYSDGTITSINGNFTGNRSDGSGGAIYNNDDLGEGKIISINANFFDNTSGIGTTSNTSGGAIANLGTIGDTTDLSKTAINGIFKGNQAKWLGGAIYNGGGRITKITGTFGGTGEGEGNKTINGSGEGGAIHNTGRIDNLNADFIGNSSSSSGGAIANSGGNIISISSSNFTNNSSGYMGGAIANIKLNSSPASITSISANFTNNTAENGGGAIYNTETIGDTTDLSKTAINGIFKGNSATNNNGGAISNGGRITKITGTFGGSGAGEGNTAHYQGGAIYNSYWDENAQIDSIVADFINNKAYSDSSAVGGAIYNGRLIKSIAGNFTGNSATTSSGSGFGGAINNDTYGTIEYLRGNFTNNTAGMYGGAIYNHKNISLVADSSNILFENNTDSTGYNDIYQSYVGNNNANLNLNANSGKSITFNGTIVGSSNSSTSRNIININNGSTNIGGSYIFNNTISNNDINIYNGANIKLGSKVQADSSTTYGLINYSGAILTNDTHGGTIDMQNGNYANANNFGKMTLGSALNIKMDIDASTATPTADTITVSSNSSGVLNINSIYFKGVGSNQSTIASKVADGTIKDFTLQVLKGNGDDAYLTIDSTLKSKFNYDYTDNVDHGTTTNPTSGSILYTDAYGETHYNLRTQKSLVIWGGTGDTDNGKKNTLKFATTQTHANETSTTYENLAVINSYSGTGSNNRSISFTGIHSDALRHGTYTMASGKTLGTTTAGTMTLAGVKSGSKLTTVNLNNNAGYNLTNATNLVLQNVDLKGSSGAPITVSNANADVTLNNSTVTGAINVSGLGSSLYDLITSSTSSVTGNITNANISNSGTLTLGGNVSNSNISNTSNLTINGNISGTVQNTYSLILKGSTIDANITGTGSYAKTYIDGAGVLSNGKSISQTIQVNSGKSLNANVKGIQGAVQNNGTLTLFSQESVGAANGYLSQAISGSGKTIFNRNVTVNANVSNEISIEDYSTYHADVTVKSGKLFGASNKNITVAANNKLTMESAADLMHAVSNSGTLVLQSGTLSKNITGGGLTQVTGDVSVKSNYGVNPATHTTVANNIQVDNGGQLTTSTFNLTNANDIKNEGKIIFNNKADGTIGSNITGNGVGAGTIDIQADENVTVTAKGITDNAVTVTSGILHLNSASSMNGTTTVAVNSGATINSLNTAIDDYTSKITLKDGSKMMFDINSTGNDKFTAEDDATVTLSLINALSAENISTEARQILTGSNVTITGESQFISGGKSYSAKGSGNADGKIVFSESASTAKLNGAVEVSDTYSATTYEMTTNEDVNTDRISIGTIKNTFWIKSDTTGNRTINAKNGTFGIIVEGESSTGAGDGKSLTVQNVTFNNFDTDTTYKGIITVNKGATLTIKDSIFNAVRSGNNIAIANYGTLNSDPSHYNGAVMVYDGATATFSGDIFNGIDRTEENGGAIVNESTGNLTVQKDTSDNLGIFTSNIADKGGAIYNEGTADISYTNFGEVDLTDPSNPVYQNGNTATANGGAIYNSGTLTVSNTNFYANSATHATNDTYGGAIYNTGSLTITDSNFYNNSAKFGGAIYSLADVTVNATASPVVFSGNSSGTSGSDIYMKGSSGNIKTLYLNAKDNTNTITFNNGDINGEYYNININGSSGYTGKVIFGDISHNDGTTLGVTVANGTVEAAKINSTSLSLNAGTLKTTGVSSLGTLNTTAGTTYTANAQSTITNGTNAGTIDGTGNLIIDGAYINNGLIKNTITINSGAGKSLQTVGADATTVGAATAGITSTVANSGTLTLTGGNILSDITGDNGKLVISNNVTNLLATVTQGTLELAADKTLTNASTLNIKNTLTTSATSKITNNSNLNLLGTDMSLIGTIDGTGTTTIGNGTVAAKLTNNNTTDGAISNDIKIKALSELVSKANALTDKDSSIVNDGTLTLTGGDFSNNVVEETAAASSLVNLQGNTKLVAGKTITQDLVKANSGSLTTDVINEGTITANFENAVSSSFKNSGTGSISGNIENKGLIQTLADKIATGATSTVTNDGTIKLTGNTLSKAINKVDTAGAGTVEIAGDVIMAATSGITDNNIKLTSGTLDVKAKANAGGDIDLSGASSIIGNGGLLDVQDNKTGIINLGAVTTTTGNELKIKIDTDLVGDGTAGISDMLTATSVAAGSKINITNIKLTDKDNGSITEDFIKIADSTIGNNVIKLTQTELTVTNGDTGNIKDLLISAEYEDGTGIVKSGLAQGTYLHTKHSTLEDAILSSILDKNFTLGASGDISGAADLTLAGNSLVINANNQTITGGAQAITLGSTQTLRIDGKTGQATVQGFVNAIDNTAGGIVQLNNVKMTSTTADVINNGTGTKGVFITGTNNEINNITDSTNDATQGQLTIGDGTTASAATIGTIKQQSVNIKNNGQLSIAAEQLETTSGTVNDGVLNLNDGIAHNKGSFVTDITGSGKTTVDGDITIGSTRSVAQGTIEVLAGTAGNENSLTNESSNVTANIDVKDNANLKLEKGSAVAGNVTLNGSNSNLNITDNGSISGNVSATNGNINLNAETVDLSLNSAVTGTISGSNYDINASANGSSNTISIDKAISGVSAINIAQNTDTVITDVAMNSTNSNINVDSNSNLTLRNTSSADMNANSAISGNSYNLSVDNVNPSQTTNINNVVSGADNINVVNGTVNINAGANSSTQARIGNSPVNINSGATAKITTTADSFVVNNNVSGADSSSQFILNGNSGVSGIASNPGTQFNLITPVNSATLAVQSGQLNLPNENQLSSGAMLNIGSGATLNAMDGATSDYNITTQFANNSQVKIDLNAYSGVADRFVNAIQNSTDSVIITDANLQDLNKITTNSVNINLYRATNLKNIVIGSELLNKSFTVMTPIREMVARFRPDGTLAIGPSGGRNDYKNFNPAILASPVAAQLGGYISQLNSYEQAFQNIDMKMLMTREERQAYKLSTLYASTERPQVFSPIYLPEQNSAGWFRPYASFEKVDLRNGPKVNNTMYGSYFGGDSTIIELPHGWDYQYSVYVGYNGSRQSYQDNTIYQNGGNIGLTSVLYKDNFFTALTANAGAGVAEASTTFGHEDFPMLMAGVASKTGYNWELAKGKFIIQPSLLMSYTFVNAFNYTNASGIRIDTEPLHAINVTPGVKFIGNLKHGWQPYAGVQFVYNIMDKTDFKANDAALPEMSVKPYVQYGVGVQKRWGERFTGFFQTMLRSGGRSGVAFSAGFRWTFGKAPSSKNKTSVEADSNKKVIKQSSKVIKSNVRKQSRVKRFLTKIFDNSIFA